MAVPAVRQKVYSLETAETAVNGFVDKYARVNNFVAKLLDMTAREWTERLVIVFRYNNRAWNLVRDRLKRLDKHQRYRFFTAGDAEMLAEYLTPVSDPTGLSDN